MRDSIVTFGLRNATSEQLSIAIGQCFGEFLAWNGQALSSLHFIRDIQNSNVTSAIASQYAESIRGLFELGVIKRSPEYKGDASLITYLSEHRVNAAQFGLKVSAIVMLHNAFERYMWRLVRFGLVANRTEILKSIGDRTIKLTDVCETNDVHDLVDQKIDKWWQDLERDPLVSKWNWLIKLFGYPSKLVELPKWKCDIEMLERFDEVRNNATHHDGKKLAAFNLEEFAGQLLRANTVWLTRICMQMGLQIPGESLFDNRL